MIIPKNKEGYPCCALCEKDFQDGKPIVDIIMTNTARDILFVDSDIYKIEIRNPKDIRMFHQECFDLITGEDWWKQNDL